MQTISAFLSITVDLLWGTPLVILLIGGGLILMYHSKFLPLFHFKDAINLILGKKAHAASEPGQLTHFQALTNALAATIGMGNIAGVSVAIYQGGPGALFWMWVSAFVGMNTKFYECTLSLKYRGIDHTGQVQGGPMYVMSQRLGKIGKYLAIFFSICALVGTLCIFQVNQLAEFFNTYYQVPKVTVGITILIGMFYIFQGGLIRLSKVTSLLVPFMCLFYVIVGIFVIITNFELIPVIFQKIFAQAFGIDAVTGAGIGITLREVLNIGIKRAVFSNEAGAGTAPMAHSNAKTSEPTDEGLVAMVGPFLDTIVVCSITAFVILIALEKEKIELVGSIVLTTRAFETVLPNFGRHFLGLAIFLFSTTTIIGMANYNEICWKYLFKGRKFFGKNTFKLYYLSTILIASIAASGDVVNVIDIAGALMIIPNMLVTLYFAKEITTDFKNKVQNKN